MMLDSENMNCSLEGTSYQGMTRGNVNMSIYLGIAHCVVLSDRAAIRESLQWRGRHGQRT